MIRDVIILGGGSAGFLAAVTLKKKLPELAVTVVRSKEIGIIGVGESTTLSVPYHLHGYLDLDVAEFHAKTRPSWKLGIRFLWGPRSYFNYTFNLQLDWRWERLAKCNGYYCEDDFSNVDVFSAMMDQKKAFIRQPNGDPFITRNFGYHIENQFFVAYLEDKAAQLGVVIVEDILTQADRDANGITAMHFGSGTTRSADLYLDCSGFRSVLLGEAMEVPFISFRPTLFCDRAVVSAWKRQDETINPYTTAETMSSGWCWQIDQPDRIARGYVYSSAFLSDEDAEREFRQKNPKVEWTRLVKFSTGRYERSWEKNVVAIGNSCGFVEPLESTALTVICDELRYLAEILAESDRQPGPSVVSHYNRINARMWDCIRDFLGVHYKFNTRYDTPFWRACRADADLGHAQELVDYYQENGPSTIPRGTLIRANDFCGIEGYYVLLVGQKVPYRRRHSPTPEEARIWNGICAENRLKALTALSAQQALDAIAAPTWKWTPGFFRTLVPSGNAVAQPSLIGAV